MAALEYTVVETEASRRQARIAALDNRLLERRSMLPAAMFHVQTGEEMDAVRRYYFEGLPSDHILGFTVPLSRLPAMARSLQDHVPHGLALLCDVETEMFWWNDMREHVRGFHRRHTITSDETREAIGKVASATRLVDKMEAHKAMWDGLLRDKRRLLSMLTRYVNLQSAHGVDILPAPGPLLADRDGIDQLEECFALAKGLYGDGTALEGQGRQLALYANLHTQFLAKARNVPELERMIERAAPGALAFKIFNLEDIRRKPTFAANYDELVRSLSRISQSMGIPAVYMSAQTAGYRANLMGIDAFSEPFNHPVSTMRKRGGRAGARQPSRGFTELSGRIYDAQTGEFVTREAFHDTCLSEAGVRSPVPGVARTDPAAVRAMTDARFREFSKTVLMQSRNYEEAQLHEGIRAGDVDYLWLKIGRWWDRRGGA